MWAGPTFHRLTLGPGSTHVLQQTACFVSAGVYNVNMLHVTAGSVDDIEMIVQRAVSASPIVIHDAATTPLDTGNVC